MARAPSQAPHSTSSVSQCWRLTGRGWVGGTGVDEEEGPLPARLPQPVGLQRQGQDGRKERTPDQQNHKQVTQTRNETTQQLKWDEEEEGEGGECRKQGTK